MKASTSILFCLVLCLFAACNQNNSNEYYQDHAEYYQDDTEYYQDGTEHYQDNAEYYQDDTYNAEYGQVENTAYGEQGIYLESNFSNNEVSSNNSPIEMKPITDPKTGRITSYAPYPANWKVVTGANGAQEIQGPNGIIVNSLPTEVYYFNVDPNVARAAGKKVANPEPIQTNFQNRIIPAIQQGGGQLIKQYPLPEIAQRSHQLVQGALNRSRVQSYDIIASEWEKPNGIKVLVLFTQMIMHSQGGSSWGVSLSKMEAPAQYFESAKETYLFAQANWQIDQKAAMAHAANLQQMDRESEARLAQSRAAHNARMRNNEAAFQATQKHYVDTQNEISDISMQGYRDRSASQDRLRNAEVNMIHEENTMTNPWDNKSHQVKSGYQYYYMNAKGQVIGSNNPNFNPNENSKFNHIQWRKMSGSQR